MNVFHDIKLSAAGDLHFVERVWLLREKIAEIMPDCSAASGQESLVKRQMEQVHARKKELAGMPPEILKDEPAGAAS